MEKRLDLMLRLIVIVLAIFLMFTGVFDSSPRLDPSNYMRAIDTGDISYCGDSLIRDSCIIEAAYMRKNALLCDAITNKRSTSTFDYSSLCRRIPILPSCGELIQKEEELDESTARLRVTCYIRVAEALSLRNVSKACEVCEALPGPEREKCRKTARKYIDEAAETCDQSGDEGSRDDCYDRKAAFFNDKETCAKIINQSMKDACISR